MSRVAVADLRSATCKWIGLLPEVQKASLEDPDLTNYKFGIHSQGLGYVISLAAFAWYNYLKLNPTKSGVAYSMLPTKDSDADLHEKGGEPLNSHGNPPSTWQRISGAV